LLKIRGHFQNQPPIDWLKMRGQFQNQPTIGWKKIRGLFQYQPPIGWLKCMGNSKVNLRLVGKNSWVIPKSTSDWLFKMLGQFRNQPPINLLKIREQFQNQPPIG
jgi:hypothetical protein